MLISSAVSLRLTVGGIKSVMWLFVSLETCLSHYPGLYVFCLLDTAVAFYTDLYFTNETFLQV